MIKKGDKFTNLKTGEVLTVGSVKSSTVILVTKDNTHSFIVDANDIESAFAPYVEEEQEEKPKKQ